MKSLSTFYPGRSIGTDWIDNICVNENGDGRLINFVYPGMYYVRLNK